MSRNKKSILSFAIFAVFAIITFLLHIYLMIPIFFPNLTFSFADLSALFGPDSALLGFQKMLYPYDSSTSMMSLEYYRYGVLPTLLFLIGSFFSFTESWVWGVMTLLALCIGIYGMYKLFKFEMNSPFGAVVASSLLLFYFFNYYAIGRIVHIYIWFGYLVLPYLVAELFEYEKTRILRHLLAVVIVFSQFFVFPHGFIYGVLALALVSLLLIVRNKDFLLGIQTFFVSVTGYCLLNIQIFLTVLMPSTQYPIPANLSMFSLLSRNGTAQNTLTFINNWWHYVDISQAQAYVTVAGVMSFLIALMLVFYWYAKLIYKQTQMKSLQAPIIAFFLIAVVIASLGTNSVLIKATLEWAAANNLLSAFLVFREWARILVLLPFTYLLVFKITFEDYSATTFWGNFTRMFVPMISLLMILLSPFLLPSLFAKYKPIQYPEIYYTIQKKVGQYSTILWFLPKERIESFGLSRFIWDTDKTPDLIDKSIGKQYGNASLMTLPIQQFLRNESSNTAFLNDLLIEFAIDRKDIHSKSNAINRPNSDLNFQLSGEYLQLATIAENDSNSRQARSFVDLVANPNIWQALSIAGYHALPMTSLVNTYESYPLLTDDLKSESAVVVESCKVSNCAKSIYPYNFLSRHDPTNVWSRGTTSQLIQEPFFSYLQENGIVTYQHDEGHGVAFTINSGATENLVDISQKNTTVYAKILVSEKGGDLAFQIGNQKQMITTFAKYSRFQWKNVGTFSDAGTLKIINVKGFNAISEIVVINSTDVGKLQLLGNQLFPLDQRISVIYPEFQGNELLSATSIDVVCSSEGKISLIGKETPCSAGQKFTVNKVAAIDTPVIVFIKGFGKVESFYESLQRLSPIEFKGTVERDSSSRILLISELFDPEWKAYVLINGQKNQIKGVRIYGFMQGFFVPAGAAGEISIVYDSALRLGPWRLFSLVAPLIAGLLWCIMYVTKAGKERQSNIPNVSNG